METSVEVFAVPEWVFSWRKCVWLSVWMCMCTQSTGHSTLYAAGAAKHRCWHCHWATSQLQSLLKIRSHWKAQYV